MGVEEEERGEEMSWLTDWLSGKPTAKRVGPLEQKYIDGCNMITEVWRKLDITDHEDFFDITVRIHMTPQFHTALYMGSPGKYAAEMSPEGHIYNIGYKLKNGLYRPHEQWLGHGLVHQLKREYPELFEEPDMREWE